MEQSSLFQLGTWWWLRRPWLRLFLPNHFFPLPSMSIMVLNTACVPYSFPLYTAVHIKVNYNHNVSTLNMGKKNKCEFWRSFNTAVIKQTDKQTNKNQTLEELWNQLKSSLSHAILQSYLTQRAKKTKTHWSACMLAEGGWASQSTPAWWKLHTSIRMRTKGSPSLA